ncbi:MAG: FAD-dependent oxidoreductase [Clostridia bacterium]|nr:FAD-dependent oxidoreductase [Clostridia bacterium]
MARTVAVVGGGWAGCAAAVAAAQAGAEVILIERTNLLLGTGLVGGIMNNNGRFTAARELSAMGGGYLFDVIDQVTIHRRVDFPGHNHASLYDVTRVESEVRTALSDLNIHIMLESRAVDVAMDGPKIKCIVLADGDRVPADAFVEATGTAGPQGNCVRVSGGCVMCILRCPTFGPRVSVASKAGVSEVSGSLFEAVSGSCKLQKKSLSAWLVRQLEERGVLVIPVPRYVIRTDKTTRKACQQYALPEYYENIILLDTGHAKLMAPFFPLEQLRLIPGFESALFDDPYAGGRGNSVRYTVITPHDCALKATGVDNLFCAGEKVGLLVGHTEAICTGTLAGHNAVRRAAGRELLALPTSLACGDIIAFIDESLKTPAGFGDKYTFAGGVYFNRMYENGLYTTDLRRISDRVRAAGMEGVFQQKIT